METTNLLKRVQVNGLWFSVRVGNTDEWVLNEVIAENVYQLPPSLEGKTVIDIGGHIGSFAVYAASLGARVYTYEPTKLNFSLLLANVLLNRFDIKLFKLGVTGKREKRKVYFRADNYGALNMYSDEEEMLEKVKCISLDNVFESNNIKHCNILKLDCEGAEVEILKATSMLGKIDEILVETHRGDRMEVFNLLKYTHSLVWEGEGKNPILKFSRLK